MKTLILLSTFATLSASASPILTRTITNGTVSPEYRTLTTCEINENSVQIRTTGRLIDFPYTEQRQIKFTHLVPNAVVMQSLSIEAARTTTIQDLRPTVAGSGVTTTFVTLADGTPSNLELLLGNQPVERNPSPAARKLLQFVALNCK
jgi:hypothetical protein